jgi:hypothetical protein
MILYQKLFRSGLRSRARYLLLLITLKGCSKNDTKSCGVNNIETKAKHKRFHIEAKDQN